MRKVIYYPNFEIKDEIWLKFALLYLEEVNPIIPFSGEKTLSEKFRYFMNSTDLIRPIRPRHPQSIKSSLDAIYSIEKILRNPKRFSSIFRTRNILKKWQLNENHDTELFTQKYSPEWYSFCIDNGIASQSEKGIKIPQEVALIFMSILANTIGEVEGIETITDNIIYDNLSILVRQTPSRIIQKRELIRGVIDLKVPANLADIDISEVIKLRNKNGYKEKIRAFHKELDNYLSNQGQNVSAKHFIDSVKYNLKELVKDIITIGTGSLSVGLGTWLAINSSTSEILTNTKEIAGLISFIGTSIKIESNWKNTKSTKYCRKYFADLSEISS